MLAVTRVTRCRTSGSDESVCLQQPKPRAITSRGGQGLLSHDSVQETGRRENPRNIKNVFPLPCSLVPAAAEGGIDRHRLSDGGNLKRLRACLGFFRSSSDTDPSSEKVDQNHTFIRLQIMRLNMPRLRKQTA